MEKIMRPEPAARTKIDQRGSFMPAKILGIASYLPQTVETVEDIRSQQGAWPVDKIAEKTGIRSRHIADPSQTAGDLATEAARRLLAQNLVPREQIDYLIFCSQSPDYPLPSTSCVLQARLGLNQSVGAFDFQLGCSGYVYGLQLAHLLVTGGEARNVLLVTADTYSKYIHPQDRTVRMLFGDAAAATLIGPAAPEDRGMGPFVVGTDGEGAEKLIVPAGGSRLPCSTETAREVEDDSGCVRSQNHLFMDGQAVFSFAISRVPDLISAVLAKAHLKLADVDWFVFHQANRFMLENLAACSRIPREKMVYHLETVGNTVSSSIPLAIEAYQQAGTLRPGQTLLLVGFGVGYSWGACLVHWAGTGEP
jgi:3-oxoacyl-[acyl-carrier-protein] synthase III